MSERASTHQLRNYIEGLDLSPDERREADAIVDEYELDIAELEYAMLRNRWQNVPICRRGGQ